MEMDGIAVALFETEEVKLILELAVTDCAVLTVVVAVSVDDTVVVSVRVSVTVTVAD